MFPPVPLSSWAILMSAFHETAALTSLPRSLCSTSAITLTLSEWLLEGHA